MKQQSNAWIFVSHSTKDVEHVRAVRNYLEGRGAEPLLFFLKALEEAEELRILLRREIDARNFFLVCDSPHSRNSRWVREEIEYVRGWRQRSQGVRLPRKRIHTIDITTAIDSDLGMLCSAVTTDLDRLLEEATVFLSYARADAGAVRPFFDVLAENDFAVFLDAASVVPAASWSQQIHKAVTTAARNGWLLVFLSRAALGSQFVLHEIAAYLAQGGARLLPIALEPVASLGPLPPDLSRFQILDASSRDFTFIARDLLQALSL